MRHVFTGTFSNVFQFEKDFVQAVIFAIGLLVACATQIAHAQSPSEMQQVLALAKAGSDNPPRSILYVGNSFIYYNNSLHNIVSRIAQNSIEGKLARHRATSITISGAGFDWHDLGSYLRPDGLGRYSFVGDNEVRFNPPGRQYDSVLLMDCSQCPVHPTLSKIFFEFAKKHSDTARAIGVEPMLLMTWAYADKPEMTKGLADAYTEAGRQNNAHVIPAGLAFAASISKRPDINLYASEKRHPSLEGSYLAGATIVASVWRVNPVGSKFTGGLSEELQDIYRKSPGKLLRPTTHDKSVAGFRNASPPDDQKFATTLTQARLRHPRYLVLWQTTATVRLSQRRVRLHCRRKSPTST